ncbi:hypothetical protein ES703_61986 [subsurface metagenome]
MADEIRVRIIPGCPGVIVAEDEESKELAKATLANATCGCLVKTEAEVAELTEAEEAEESEEAEEPTSELAEEAEESEESEEGPSCSLEPDKPWEESICGIVSKDAADRVLAQLREEGVIA